METTNPTELLRWWHQYQAQTLTQETDLIRNGLLQEMIALRRRLEMACPAPPPGEMWEDTPLAEMGRLYGLLENFCDRLESPYLQDSLPLALQHTLQPWQHRLNLHAELPAQWSAEPIEQTRLLVLLLKTLLPTLAAASAPPQRCELRLTTHHGTKHLTWQSQSAADALALNTALASTLTPFLQTFRLLTQGAWDMLVQSDTFFLELTWLDAPPVTD
ncbi:MAG TPA: hypothetical protein V6D02_15010 [Candidatus Obscuribacterales bacterium]